MASQHGHSSTNVVHELLDQAIDLLAEAIAEKLKSEIHHLVQHTAGIVASTSPTQPAASAEPRSLWTLGQLAKDSGLSKSTWYKWVYQRKIPVVRLGRAVRVRDSDYRRLLKVEKP